MSNDDLMTIFACYMIELLAAKKVIDEPKTKTSFDDAVVCMRNDFKKYAKGRGVDLDAEQSRKFTITRKVIVMCRGSELSN